MWMTIKHARPQSAGPFLCFTAEMCWQTPFMEIQLVNWGKEPKDFLKWNKLFVGAATRTAWQCGVSECGRNQKWCFWPEKLHEWIAVEPVLRIIYMKGAAFKSKHQQNPTLTNQNLSPKTPTGSQEEGRIRVNMLKIVLQILYLNPL